MTRLPRIPLEVALTLFLALMGQTFLLIPHRQGVLIGNIPPLLVITGGMAIWTLSRWLKISIFTNAHNEKRPSAYVLVATIGIFVFRYVQTGFIIEGSLLAVLAMSLFVSNGRKADVPAQFAGRLTIALGNSALGILLILAPRLFLTPIYSPLLNWQTELGIVFF